MKRHVISRFSIFLKGMAMGIADIIPGVSGGTIAIITGVYEEFLATLNNIDIKTNSFRKPLFFTRKKSRIRPVNKSKSRMLKFKFSIFQLFPILG